MVENGQGKYTGGAVGHMLGHYDRSGGVPVVEDKKEADISYRLKP